MTRRPARTLIGGPAFRRRVRGLKARSDWDAAIEQRAREIAVFDALPLGQRALHLGQEHLDPLTGVCKFVVDEGGERQIPDLVHELEGVGGVAGREGGHAHQQPTKRMVLSRFGLKRARGGQHPSIRFEQLALQLGHALFKGLHRLLSNVLLRRGEEAESPAGANPPPAPKRSADQ